MPFLRLLIAVLLLTSSSGRDHAHAQLAPSAPPASAIVTNPTAPEAASGLSVKTLVTARRHIVAAANPRAAEAGREILRQGGNAVDAMVATQLVLNLVEPQSSGLGGGAFLVHYDASRRITKTYDGRETAPAAATPNLFMKSDGTPLPFPEAVASGLSVGTPGLLPLLFTAHKAHGKLALDKLIAPALKLTEDGFPISPRLAKLLAEHAPQLATFNSDARAYFFDANGAPRPVGYILKSPAFADTLRAIAKNGSNALASGPIADAIIQAVATAPKNPGPLAQTDLAAYRVKERPPVCIVYRKHKICGMGPPSSGALTIAQTLKLIEPFDLGAQPLNAPALHLIAEAEKLAYADRDRYIADPDTVPLPAGLLDPAYLSERRQWIDPAKAKPKADAGTPKGAREKRVGFDATIEAAGTSHISIIDAQGNAVALTTTIENAFGSRLMAAGFLLNNQLTDFSFRPTDAEGRAIANAVGPNKRPRSSMSPTLIFAPDGRLKAVLGSAGGSRIILHVVKSIVAIVDWKLDAQATADLAHFGSRNGPFEIETNIAGALPSLHMLARGHKIDHVDAPSGLHILIRRPNGTLEGGADPRREGIASGD